MLTPTPKGAFKFYLIIFELLLMYFGCQHLHQEHLRCVTHLYWQLFVQLFIQLYYLSRIDVFYQPMKDV
jgi:hypothetical protein